MLPVLSSILGYRMNDRISSDRPMVRPQSPGTVFVLHVLQFALDSARTVFLSSESHNSDNFCPILTNYVSKSELRTCLINDTNFTD